MRDVSTWRLMVRLYGPWRKRLIFFALCVALGVGALFSVGNLLSVMTEHIGDRARTMLGGDVRISSWQRLDATARDHLNGALAEWPDAATTDTREMASMVKRVQRRPTAKTSGEDRPFLVTLKAVTAPYPLVGEIETEPQDALAAVLSLSLIHI